MTERILHWLTLVLLGATVACRLVTATDGAVQGITCWIPPLALLAVGAYLLWQWMTEPGQRIRLGWNLFDVSLALLIGGHIVGAIMILKGAGDKRAALNMLCEWIGVGATAFLFRQLCSPAPEPAVDVAAAAHRTLFGGMIVALAMSISGLGIYQHLVVYAELGKEFREIEQKWDRLQAKQTSSDPRVAAERAQLQLKMAQLQIPEDPNDRETWRNRVLNSSEPYGLFALTNTLAGLLLPVELLLLSLFWHGARRREPLWMLVSTAVAAAVVGYCLLLTKSRTAYVGLGVGLIAWTLGELWTWWLARGIPVSAAAGPVAVRRPFARRAGMLTLAGFLLVAAMIAAAWQSGGLDRLVLSESGKSLRYRLEWWRSTVEMLKERRENWVWGIGPGNFRQNYLPHKLPESSEEIADPHNLVLDVWANGGLMALLGLLGLGLATIQAVAQGSVQRAGADPRKDGRADQPVRAEGPRWRLPFHPVVWGLVFGIFGALTLDGNEDLSAVLAGALVALLLVMPLLERVGWPVVASFAAAAALAVHLCGAGGIALPAINQWLILLAACVVPRGEARAGAERLAGWIRSVAGVCVVCLFSLCWWNFSTLVTTEGHVAAGRERLYRDHDPERATSAFRAAAKSDPWAALPHELLAAVSAQRAGDPRQPDAALFDRAVEEQQAAIARDPLGFTGYRALGLMYLQRFSRTNDSADARLAARWLSEAGRRYPNLAALQAERAETLWKGELKLEASLVAQRALDLHAASVKAGHPDKQLKPERLRRIQAIKNQIEP